MVRAWSAHLTADSLVNKYAYAKNCQTKILDQRVDKKFDRIEYCFKQLIFVTTPTRISKNKLKLGLSRVVICCYATLVTKLKF